MRLLPNETIEAMQNEQMPAFLVLRLNEAYRDGGNAALLEKLEMYGLNSENPVDRDSAVTLARIWGLEVQP